MFAAGNKKMLNMLILEILKEYSDADHRLSQKEIIRLLELNYDVKCDRRSVKSNIVSLIEMDYEISISDGYYLMGREFEDSELRMLIDSVLFSSSISTMQAKTIIDKLKKQSNKYFSAKVSHVSNLPELFHVDNKQVMYTLDTLNDAISSKKQVSFIYNSYGTDFKLHPRREEKYIVNPFQMAANNGHYYLIGNYDKYQNISHYRIDKMTEVTMLDQNCKPMSEVEDLQQGLSLPSHMAEHIYMFSGKSVKVHMIAEKTIMNELVDWFGKDFHILEERENHIVISVLCNQQAMKYWALQYGPCVEITSPPELRTDIMNSIQNMHDTYFNHSLKEEE